jgi:methionyl-tRNA formyltransferase
VRLVYLGTPEMAVLPLEALVAAGHDIALVITNPDRRRGRGGETSPTPVKAVAGRLGLPVSHAVDDVLTVGAELGVVVAFGQLSRPHLLAELGFVNLHFSLLPRWRGAAPVERALLAGDEVTGVCVMALEEGLDTGGVYARAEVPIGPTTKASDLRDELVAVGSRLLVETLAAGLGEPLPQVGEPTYANKFTADDLRIDWSASPEQIDRLIRVGGAWTTFRGKRVKIHEAVLISTGVEPTVVQPEGKAPMAFDAWRNGTQPAPGEWFQ